MPKPRAGLACEESGSQQKVCQGCVLSWEPKGPTRLGCVVVATLRAGLKGTQKPGAQNFGLAKSAGTGPLASPMVRIRGEL